MVALGKHDRGVGGHDRGKPCHYYTTIGRVVGTYKSLTTLAWLRHIEAAKMERSGRFWQHNYYEHIIRDAEELVKTRHYIRDNPSKPGKFDTDEQDQMGM